MPKQSNLMIPEEHGLWTKHKKKSQALITATALSTATILTHCGLAMQICVFCVTTVKDG
jgi:hypothetical protein